MRSARATEALAAALALALCGCGGAPSSPRDVDIEPLSAEARPAASPTAAARGRDEREVAEMLVRVASARELPVLRPVPSEVLDRGAMLARMRARVELESPADQMRYEGEVLIAFGLVPADYDVVAGVYRMLQSQVAGFYEPEVGTMFLAADLDSDAMRETLAHELVHALQDQSYSLGALLKWKPGDSDRISAGHALAEGDATSAMLDVSLGSAFQVSEAALRRLLAVSTAFSEVGSSTPRFLQASLTAAYSDGFALVQRLRQEGGWAAVDAVWRKPPETTEQMLHADKLASREPALPVSKPPLSSLGPGFSAVIEDAMGEQGLRIALEEWTSGGEAERAAAGWGGDRFVLASRAPSGTTGVEELAAAWHLRFDTAADAAEVAAVLQRRFGAACKERRDLGPLYWEARGAAIVVVVGPYARSVSGTRGTGSCEGAVSWAKAIAGGA